MFAPPFPPTNGGGPGAQPQATYPAPNMATGGAPPPAIGGFPKPSMDASRGYPGMPPHPANGPQMPAATSAQSPMVPFPAPVSTSAHQPSTFPSVVNGFHSAVQPPSQPPLQHAGAPTTSYQPVQPPSSVANFPSSHHPYGVSQSNGPIPTPTGPPQPTHMTQNQPLPIPPNYSAGPQQNAPIPGYPQTTSHQLNSAGVLNTTVPAPSQQQRQPQLGPSGAPPPPSFPSSVPSHASPGFPVHGGAMPSFPQPGFAHSSAPSGPPGHPMMGSQPSFGPPGGMPLGASAMPPGAPMAVGFPPVPGGPPTGFPGAPGMQPRQPQPQPQQRLDPNMMPSAVEVMEIDSAQAGQFPTGYPHANPPPLVSTDFYAVDQGNCSPRLMRSTIYMAPASNDLLKAAQIPFAVAISPFAALHSQEGPEAPLGVSVAKLICVLSWSSKMEEGDSAVHFVTPPLLFFFPHNIDVNSCLLVEDVYFAHLDHTGRRTDIDHRPELFLGAYEFIATKQYCKNGLPPKEPAFIFMIDVSYNAVQNGMLQVVCSNLEKLLSRLPKELGASESVIHVGLATFDQVVHFFDLSAAQPSMMVVGDVGDMFVPIVDGLLLPYSQAAPSIRAVLAEIPRLFAPTKITETILGPVVQAGLDALQCADRAGKVFIFSTSLPSLEAPGKLKARNERNLLGTDKEKTALTPQGEFYSKLGEQCVKAGVTVDLFLFPNSFMDVASIAQLSAVTGGNVYKYQYFVADKDASRFLADLDHDISRQIAFDCMARVRSSAGIRPVLFQGSFYMENSTDLEMASIDEDKSFFAELKHDDKLSDQNAIIQCAVLFTSVSGQRRLRILNICLPVSSDYNQLYRVADQGALVSYLLKNAVQANREKGNKEMKEQIFQRCAQILATYREKVSESAPLGQLILPETLKLLPLFVNSIVKNDSINGGSEMTVDDKVWMIELIRGMRVDHAMLLLYPKIVPVDHLELHDPSELTNVTGSIRASYENLVHSKAYLIDNGIVLFLWIGLGVAEAWVQDIFGVNNVAMLDTENAQIPEKDNARSRGLRRAVELLQEVGPRKRKLFVVREKDALEPWMKKFLVEDRSGPNVMSYVDFLCYIHREIRNILS
ncbi:Sec23/Sec24 trunk domain protein [Necator americanus]|uniref:Sec23/Sec24 trunk domain protein n=1 Tax=Necator americanus TaxID=51031 RepID=W2TNT0_NECAM|nr:Sec23/Sec24 trunk domain protein [Necator americanus]ETN83329.1 Sec23/Sec24 trunk domain protein [Necator americanus]